jgi:hypothetical protein
MVYAKGAATSILGSYQGTWYPKTSIIDNTQLFKAMAVALNLDISN